MPDAPARPALIAALAALALATTPTLFGIPSGAVTHAFADDHRGDDDDDDDDGGGSGGRRGSRAGGGGGSEDDRPRGRGEGPYLLEMLFGDDGGPRRARRPAPPPPLAATDEVVIDGVTPPALDRLVAEGFEVLASAPIDPARRVVRMRVPRGVSVDDALARVEAIDSTMTGGRNHYYRAQQAADATPPQEGACSADVCRDWTRIGWQPGFGGRCLTATTIGIVDTGINADHEALAGSRLELLTISGDGAPPSERKHGTAVVALLAGLPQSRIPGLVPAARIVAADPFTRIGGDERADAFGVVASIEALAASGSQVINLSFAGPENQVLANAVRRRVEAGTVLVAAVGNAGPRAAPQYPAAYPGVIGVTAVDRNDRVWRRAVQGDHVDLAAPGVGVSTAASIRGLRPQSGTSFAAPFVTAAAAVLLAADPTLKPDEVTARLAGSALDLGDPGRDPVYGHGLVQAVGECGVPVAEEVPTTAPGG